MVPHFKNTVMACPPQGQSFSLKGEVGGKAGCGQGGEPA